MEFVDEGRVVDLNSSKSKLHQTAKNKFRKFLQLIESPYGDLDEIPENEIIDSLLGKFSSYLKTTKITKYNTHDNYVSAIHVEICRKFPLKRLEFAAYYKDLRNQIFDHYSLASLQNNTPFAENAPTMQLTDRDYICKVLFFECDHELRAEISLDLTGGGRVMEVSR